MITTAGPTHELAARSCPSSAAGEDVGLRVSGDARSRKCKLVPKAYQGSAGPPRPRVVDGVIAAVALGVSVALLLHGSVPAMGSGSRLGLLTAALATLPLIAWRRAPLAVFTVSAAANALAAGAGSSIGIPLGPTAAL